MKTKQFIAGGLCFVSLVSFTACSGKSDSAKAEDTASNETNDTISADENLFDVEITIPAKLLEDSTQEEIKSQAQEAGVHDVRFNEDGSAVYTMSKKQHKELLQKYKESIDSGINDMIADNENSGFTKVEYNDDVTEFKVYCDASKYNAFSSLYALGFYIYGNYYQAINAVDQDNIKTIVQFIDKDSGEVLDTGDSTKLDNQNNEAK